MSTLTNKDFIAAAKSLKCEPGAIKAVALTESGGSSTLKTGEPKILFEAHIFHALTKGKYDRTHPSISSPFWNRNLYKGGLGEHARLAKAAAVDRDAALQSASWGLFQIMGMNWKLCGYKDVQDFVNGIYKGEAEQLKGFVNFIKNRGLQQYIQNKNWAMFAMYYNGAGYRANKYDEKMAKAYDVFKKEFA